MINIKRTFPAPEALQLQEFRGVKEKLLEMQSGKCYLCESKNSITTQIEHFIPESVSPELKYEWTNLFLACDHCNSIKNYVSDRRFSLLDCTGFDIIITEKIKFTCKGTPREKVLIESLDTCNESQITNTANLLHQIFNSQSESYKFDSKMLTDEVIKEMKKLLDVLHKYEYETFSPEAKQIELAKIKDICSEQAPFTAFKIWYIKEHFKESEIIPLLPDFNKLGQ